MAVQGAACPCQGGNEAEQGPRTTRNVHTTNKVLRLSSASFTPSLFEAGFLSAKLLSMSPGFTHHLRDCLEHSQIAAHNLNVSHPSSFRQPLSFSVMQDNKSEAFPSLRAMR